VNCGHSQKYGRLGVLFYARCLGTFFRESSQDSMGDDAVNSTGEHAPQRALTAYHGGKWFGVGAVGRHAWRFEFRSINLPVHNVEVMRRAISYNSQEC
jgi:hypothetical protein